MVGMSSTGNVLGCGEGYVSIEPNDHGISIAVRPEDASRLNDTFSRGLPDINKRFRLPLNKKGFVLCYKYAEPKPNQVDTDQLAHLEGREDFQPCEEILATNPLAKEICEDIKSRVSDNAYGEKPWYQSPWFYIPTMAVAGLYGGYTLAAGMKAVEHNWGLGAAKSALASLARGGAFVFGRFGAGGTAAVVIIAAEVGALIYVGVKNHELNDKFFVMANASRSKLKNENRSETAIEDNGHSVWRLDPDWSVEEFKDVDGNYRFIPEKDSEMSKPAFKNPEIVMEFGPADENGKRHPLINSDGSKVWHWEEKD